MCASSDWSAEGMSNREIAEKLFMSENTAQTHCSGAFDKLGRIEGRVSGE